jgi:hypothetical protein
MKPADLRAHAAIRAELNRLARYDDESLVHDNWIRQRYDCGCYPSLMPARKASVETAWHEAGHAVAALAVGARFSSASIHHSPGSEGRVHGIRGGGEMAFVVDAAGQIAQRLRDWTMLDRDDDLRAWLAAWKSDGGDARHFRAAIQDRFGRAEGPSEGAAEFAAWRYSEDLMTPLRLKVRHLARALLVHPRHLPYDVAAAIATDGAG